MNTNEKKPTMPRLLVINPNTNPAVTALVAAAAEGAVAPGTMLDVLNPPRGPFSIETAEHRKAAIPEILALVDSRPAFDACVLACFDDLCLDRLRVKTGKPAVGACEAGIALARTMAGRFSVITTVHAAVPSIERLLERYGAGDICTVRAAGIGVAAAAGDTQETEARIFEAVKLAIEQDGAEAILLGSGGLTGRAGAIAAAMSLPVIDGVAAAVRLAESAANYVRSGNVEKAAE